MTRPKWNPYLAGGMTGLLLVLSVVLFDHFPGASATFSRGAAWVEKTAGVETGRFLYFSEKGGIYGPDALPDWQLLFVAGIILGAFVSARLGGTFAVKPVPDMWAARFGPSPVKRGIAAATGGAVLIFGARLAGGCPSGHGLSGMSQLAVSGFLALACFFAGGLISATILYRD